MLIFQGVPPKAFVLEVDRVLLTKDGSLLGLFRTVGEAAKEVQRLSSDGG